MKFTCIGCGRMAYNVQCRMCLDRSRELAHHARRARRRMVMVVASIVIGLAVGFAIGIT